MELANDDPLLQYQKSEQPKKRTREGENSYTRQSVEAFIASCTLTGREVRQLSTSSQEPVCWHGKEVDWRTIFNRIAGRCNLKVKQARYLLSLLCDGIAWEEALKQTRELVVSYERISIYDQNHLEMFIQNECNLSGTNIRNLRSDSKERVTYMGKEKRWSAIFQSMKQAYDFPSSKNAREFIALLKDGFLTYNEALIKIRMDENSTSSLVSQFLRS